jgi:hypothetical protein
MCTAKTISNRPTPRIFENSLHLCLSNSASQKKAYRTAALWSLIFISQPDLDEHSAWLRPAQEKPAFFLIGVNESVLVE